MSEPITWTNEKRKLSQLIPWPRNPRQIRGEEAERLQDSLEEFGQVEPTAIGPNNELYNGHQRLKSWAAKFGDIEIDVRVSSRPLTEKEREKLTIFLHKGTIGGWDFDALANGFEFGELIEWGFRETELTGASEDEEGEGLGELAISPELHERQDYLVFYFDNEFDWNVAIEHFKIGQVYTAKVGHKTIKQKGLGRLLNASLLMELINGNR